MAAGIPSLVRAVAAEITALLSSFELEQINDTALWISEDEKAILY